MMRRINDSRYCRESSTSLQKALAVSLKFFAVTWVTCSGSRGSGTPSTSARLFAFDVGFESAAMFYGVRTTNSTATAGAQGVQWVASTKIVDASVVTVG